MSHDNYDDGLVHGHDFHGQRWASDGFDRSEMLLVADASSVNTPSSVFHDDTHHAD